MNEGMLGSNAPQGLSSQDTCRPEQPCEVRNDCAVETPRSADKIRQINIEEVNRGFIVRVGCHTFAISTKAELTTKLTEYINEPDKTEKKWYDKTLF